ncbi:MAG: NOG1 family protein [Thermoprotei archaeon]
MPRNPFEGVKLPPEVEAFISSLLSRIRKVGGTTIKDRELRRLALYRDSLKVYEDFVRSVPSIDGLHPFYRTALELIAGDLERVKVCLGAVSRGVRLARKVVLQYMKEIRANEEDQANALMRAGFGRASSILRRRAECVSYLRKVFAEARKLMAIDPDLPTIIVAGPPNVGKSTLVSRISTAKPEVASYPFTTKEIHVGHIRTDWGLIQVIDTPGILDRPMEERNVIEKKAINAIVNLKGVIVFMFDVSTGALYSAEEQISLFEEVSGLKPTVPVLNKVDVQDEGLRKLVEDYLKGKGVRFFTISAEKGEGVEELVKFLLESVK